MPTASKTLRSDCGVRVCVLILTVVGILAKHSRAATLAR
jgi:hypothetical protein